MSRHRLAYLCGCAVALALAAFAAQAVPIYKCRAPDGALTYQDNPCPEGTEQPAPRIAPPPAYQPPAPQMPPLAGQAPVKGDFQPVRDEPPPPPMLFRCYDGVTGKGYVSDYPQQNLRYVPLWTVMPSGSSLGGLSAGILPPDPGVTASLANYTEVQDRCHQMSVGELCGYWGQHVDEVRAKRRRAFKDTRAQLEQEEAYLNEMLAAHCGR